MGDGFVILLVRAALGGEVPERFRHASRGFREWKPPQIDPRHADVVSVMEIRDRAGFKRREEFVVRKLEVFHGIPGNYAATVAPAFVIP